MLRVLALRQGDRRLVLETSVLENPYGDKFTLCTRLIKPTYIVISLRLRTLG